MIDSPQHGAANWLASFSQSPYRYDTCVTPRYLFLGAIAVKISLSPASTLAFNHVSNNTMQCSAIFSVR
jgi:hypothetical protein